MTVVRRGVMLYTGSRVVAHLVSGRFITGILVTSLPTITTVILRMMVPEILAVSQCVWSVYPSPSVLLIVTLLLLSVVTRLPVSGSLGTDARSLLGRGLGAKTRSLVGSGLGAKVLQAMTAAHPGLHNLLAAGRSHQLAAVV